MNLSEGRGDAAVPLDPFVFKRYSKLNPGRVAYTLYARAAEWYSRCVFDRTNLKLLDDGWPAVADFSTADTAVTPRQMGALLYFIGETERLPGTAVVEIGSYRGITTAKLAAATRRKVYAVDPFIGYGAAEDDYRIFLSNTKVYPSIQHVRKTSGVAAKQWAGGDISFVFVDAVHDYVNTMHDVVAWSKKLVPGGMLGMHDTDNGAFAGTRRAAWRIAQRMRPVCHIPDLVILQKQ